MMFLTDSRLLWQVLSPLVLGLQVVVGDAEEGSTSWRRGQAHKFHVGFPRGSACLTAIAGYAGTNHIFPGMLTVAIAGDDMIQGEMPGLLSAVLAGVPVTVENLKAG